MEKLRAIFLMSCLAVIALLCYLSGQLGRPMLIFHGTIFPYRQQVRFKSSHVNNRLRYNRSEQPIKTSGHHEILWWNEPHWMTNSKWNKRCNLSLCEYNNCHVTFDKTKVKQSSVVILSIVDGEYEDAPITKRNPSQPWVFFTLESPASFLPSVRRWYRVFNWSMTYHHDADIFIPYGRLGDRTPPDKDYSAIFRTKTKQVAWIVSHCYTSAKREKYIDRLRRYIEVDTFGKCNNSPLDDSSRPIILSKYKFYLGFEHALCRDYVTEKYFHYLTYDIIVVVRGSIDYNHILPNRTYINTADFKSIESLGRFLNRLSNNETEYIQYLKAKDKYLVHQSDRNYCDGLCNICERTNNVSANKNMYNTVTEWTGKCVDPQDLDKDSIVFSGQ